MLMVIKWLNLPLGGGFSHLQNDSKCALNTVISVLQRGAKTEDVGEILSLPPCPQRAPWGPSPFQKEDVSMAVSL